MFVVIALNLAYHGRSTASTIKIPSSVYLSKLIKYIKYTEYTEYTEYTLITSLLYKLF